MSRGTIIPMPAAPMDVSIASGTCTTPCMHVVVGLVGSTYFSCRSVYSRCTGGARQTPSLRICYISSNVCHALSPLPFVVVFAHVRPCVRVYSTPYVALACACVCARKEMERFDRGGPRLAPPSEFVFGGLRIVWISNDCARAYTTRFPRLSDLPSFYDPLPFLLSEEGRIGQLRFLGIVSIESFYRSLFKRNLYLRIYIRLKIIARLKRRRYVIFFWFQKYLRCRFFVPFEYLFNSIFLSFIIIV